MLKMIFMILWVISVIAWIIYAIKTIMALIKNTGYMEQTLKMTICCLFVLIFNLLIQIFK